MYELGAERSTQEVTNLRQAIGAQPGTLHAVCPPPESSGKCHLSGAVAVFAASDPVIQGDTATVIIEAIWLSVVTRRDIEGGIFVMTLARSGDRWTRHKIRTLRIT